MMDFIRDLKSDVSARRRILCDPSAEPERRVFAGLELFCFPVSILTVFGLLPLRLAAARCGWTVPAWGAPVMTVLLSAAVGYLTNYIAIEMLFKPYRRKKWHPLSLLTFGYWQQGLVPRNKDRIGAELGRQIETRLIDPEQLSDELCAMVTGFLRDGRVIGALRDNIQSLVRAHERSIVDFLIPRIEESLGSAIGRILTRERMERFWAREIEPRVNSGENRAVVAAHIIEGLQRRSPQLIDIARRELRDAAHDYLKHKLPFGVGADALSDGLVAFVRWDTVEVRLRDKLGETEIREMVRQEVGVLSERLDVFLKSPEGVERIEAALVEVRAKLRDFLSRYLHETLPEITRRMVESEDLWAWVENDLLPAARPRIEALIQEHGKVRVIEKLHLATRVADAVHRQDVREFHDMLNSIAAQHLGAIQVLGYFLGAIVGAAQIFC